MSGLIIQPCLRLITHTPLGGRNRKKRRGDKKGHMGSTHHHLSFISTSFLLGTRQDFDKGTRTPLKTSHHPPPVPLCLSTLPTSHPIHSCLLEHLEGDSVREVWVEIKLIGSEDYVEMFWALWLPWKRICIRV